MTSPVKDTVFVDSDVVISSLISDRGAAFLLLDQQWARYFISNKSQEEMQRVAERLSINKQELEKVVKEKLKITKLSKDLSVIKKEYGGLVLDEDDAHIIAGAETIGADFLITYNQKHYKIEKIKRKLDIITYTPAQLLQYFRSKS